jgi:hypothetical protein
MHKLLGPWFQEHTDIRDSFTRHQPFDILFCYQTIDQLESAARATGRDHPVPRISERKAARLARDAAIAGARAEQAREGEALAALDVTALALGIPAAAAPPAAHAAASGEVPSAGGHSDAGTAGRLDHGERPAKQPRICAMG